ncbi:MAG: hypothetical protein Q9197_005859 [Variospora fuerteventurae]
MRNLRCVGQKSVQNVPGIEAIAWDASSDSILNLRAADGLLHLDRWTEEGLQPIASWDAPPTPYKAINLHFFADTGIACIILDIGDLIVVRESPDNEEKIEIVGSIDAAISAAAWSPDEETLVVTTKASTIVYLTRDFEELTSVELTSRDLDLSDHVSVGWGKKETQFKGKKARALRDPTVPETIDDGRLADTNESCETTISWRGDGAYLAVNSVENASQRRMIRVYSREGILDSVSEPVNGLIGPLSWRPAGNLIAGVQLFEDKRQVVFFERNGLRHGQFPLRPLDGVQNGNGVSVHSLQWNVDSTVLAVTYDDRVQLWTMGNYHWYLKQEIMDPGLKWHPEKPLVFALISKSKERIRRLQYSLEVCAGPILPPFDYGVVAVIDGKSLKITPLRQANIPPPMSLHDVNLPANANDVVITLDGSDNGTCREPIFRILVLHQTWSSSYSLDLATMLPPTQVEKPAESRETSHVANAQEKLDSGLRLSLEFRSTEVAPGPIKMTENGSLLANGRVLARGCTSYLVTPSHLIFTTSQQLLKLVHLIADTEALEVPSDTPESDERCRSIERGAKLVTAMPSIFAVVLQMPRGNLETIYPRALVLAGIRQSITKKKYKKAFLACRHQRVNMNILHDHHPEQFIANIPLIIDQIKKVEFIDLFLSSLREEDVSATMYRETLRAEQREDDGASSEGGGKVNIICNAFLEALASRKANVKNMITAQVCKNPPDLDAGLIEIVRLREKGSDRVEETVEHICFLADVNRLFDNALGLYDLQLTLLIAQQSQKDPREYLPFLQGFELMEPVRRKFSIDDHLGRFKKALHHLHDLSAFDELQAYTVRHNLYEHALSLHRHDTAKYASLMRLYADNLKSTSRFKEAATAFHYLGDHAQASECHRNANQWQDALSTASLIPLSTAQLRAFAETLAHSAVETRDFRAAATIHLDHLHDVPAAANYFCKAYLFSDAFRAIATLPSSSQPNDLLASVFDSALADSMAVITDLIADCKAQLSAQVPRIRELREKKQADPLAFLEGDNAGADVPDDISIAPTDASTAGGGTLFTRYTNRSATGAGSLASSRRSSRNRRREERKRARGKKGSVYEEEYLVSSVARLVERVNGVGEEVGRLVEWLVRRTMVERARAVETGMVEVVEMCGRAVEEVFAKEEGEVEGQEKKDTPVVKEYRKLSFLTSG